MTQLCLVYRAERYRCAFTEDGIHKTEYGCAHLMPGSGVSHNNALASRSGQLSDLAAGTGSPVSSRDDAAPTEAPDEDGLASGVPAAGAVPPVPAAPDFGF